MQYVIYYHDIIHLLFFSNINYTGNFEEFLFQLMMSWNLPLQDAGDATHDITSGAQNEKYMQCLPFRGTECIPIYV